MARLNDGETAIAISCRCLRCVVMLSRKAFGRMAFLRFAFAVRVFEACPEHLKTFETLEYLYIE